MLLTEGARVLRTLEMPHCKDLLPTVRLWNHQLKEQWEQGNLTRPVLAYMGLPLVLGTCERHVCEDLSVGRTLLARWGCKSRFTVCIVAFCK